MRAACSPSSESVPSPRMAPAGGGREHGPGLAAHCGEQPDRDLHDAIHALCGAGSWERGRSDVSSAPAEIPDQDNIDPPPAGRGCKSLHPRLVKSSACTPHNHVLVANY